MWSQIDDDLVLRLTPSKTEESSQARVVFDLKAYPMVVEELANMPDTGRCGPLIVNPRTGLPYRHDTSACSGTSAPPLPVYRDRFGIVICALAVSLKLGRPALQQMTLRKRQDMPANGPPRRSMTANVGSRSACCQRLGSLIGTEPKHSGARAAHAPHSVQRNQ